jgi:hypothetical protein
MAAMDEHPSMLQSIPLELRLCIYRYAFTDSSESRDIRIDVELNEDDSVKSGEFKAPALDVLVEMKEVSTSLYDEAVEHLTSYIFTWILVSELQPHVHLIRSL